MEHADCDLHSMVRSPIVINNEHCRFLFYDLLKAFAIIHKAGIIHRDVKPSNILVNMNDCSIRICDFGLARGSFSPSDRMKLPHFSRNASLMTNDSRITTAASDDDPENAYPGMCGGQVTQSHSRPLTEYVITRWYRPPEVLLCSAHYNSQVDVWGIGCIMAEVLMRRVIFPGCDNGDQMRRICSVLGKPQNLIESVLTFHDFAEKSAMDMSLVAQEANDSLGYVLAAIEDIPTIPQQSLSSLFDKSVDPNLIDLISKLLIIDPQKRWTAERALTHRYFSDLQKYDTFFFPRGPIPSFVSDGLDFPQLRCSNVKCFTNSGEGFGMKVNSNPNTIQEAYSQLFCDVCESQKVPLYFFRDQEGPKTNFPQGLAAGDPCSFSTRSYEPKGLASIRPMSWSFDSVPHEKKEIQKMMLEEIVNKYHPEMIVTELSKLINLNVQITPQTFKILGERISLPMRKTPLIKYTNGPLGFSAVSMPGFREVPVAAPNAVSRSYYNPSMEARSQDIFHKPLKLYHFTPIRPYVPKMSFARSLLHDHRHNVEIIGNPK